MPSDAIPIVLARVDRTYDAPQRIQILSDAAAELISKDIARVAAAGDDLENNLLLSQAAESLTEHSHYLWQRARVLRVGLIHRTTKGGWDSQGTTRLYRGLQQRPLSHLRELCLGQVFSSIFIAAILLHTPRLEVLDVTPTGDSDCDVHPIFDEAVGKELFHKGIPFARFAFKLRKLAFRGTDALFFCHIFNQSRWTIEWLSPPIIVQTPQIMECLEQGNCVTTLIYPFGIYWSDAGHPLITAFPRLRRLVLGARDLMGLAPTLIQPESKASLRYLVVGWYIPVRGKCGSNFFDDRRMQETGLENLLGVLPQLVLRELSFATYRRDGASISMPFSPQLMEGIRAACRRRRTRITHSVITSLADYC